MSHGGKRAGAGRPVGKNKYGEATKPVRLPISKIDAVHAFLANKQTSRACPLYASKVQAGFPSPADDYIERSLDLNEHLIQHPAATFFVKAAGDSMINAGIFPGDILIVDKSLTASHNKIVIAAIDGELTVKRLHCRGNDVQLLADNPNYPAIQIKAEADLVIWGVVTHVIHATT